jgi:hypothetical protein
MAIHQGGTSEDVRHPKTEGDLQFTKHLDVARIDYCTSEIPILSELE